MDKIRISDAKVGDKIQFGSINEIPLVWLIGELNHEGYPSDTVNIVTEGTIGNMAFAPGNPIDKIKERRLYGSNVYRDSYVRHRLNSDDFITAVFTKEEVAAIVETPLDTLLPDIDGGGVSPCIDRLFLFSASEVGLTEDDGEGSIIELFKDPRNRCAKDIEGDHDWWFLRSAIVSVSYNVRLVSYNGTASNLNAYSGSWGVRPACNLKSDYLVSVLGGAK